MSARVSVPWVEVAASASEWPSFLLRESNIHPAIHDDDFKRFLRYPVSRTLDGPLAENAAWARTWFAAHGRPWCAAVGLPLRAEPGRGLWIDGERFGSPSLAHKLAGIPRAVLVIASAGPEADMEAAARWAAGEPDRYFFLECYAAAAAEALLGEVRRWLGASFGARIASAHCGPGYGDWPIGEAQRLLARVAAAGSLPGPIDALPSGMLCPKKSHLVIYPLTSSQEHGLDELRLES